MESTLSPTKSVLGTGELSWLSSLPTNGRSAGEPDISASLVEQTGIETNEFAVCIKK